jgi:hypothetical protein
MTLEFNMADILIDNAKFQIDWLRNRAPIEGISVESQQDIADTLEGFINYINEMKKV